MGMNTTDTLDADGEFVIGYATRDFAFLLACMSIDEPGVDIRVQQCVRVPPQRGRMDQVRFHLAVYRNGALLANSVPFFEALRIRYQNNELRVDPRKYDDQARTLRGMTFDVLERGRDGGRKPEGSRM